MQLLPFATDVAGVGRRTHLGALVSPTTVVDLRAAAVAASAHAGLPVRSAERITDGLVPVDVSAFVANGERGLAEARRALAWQADAGDVVGPTGARLTYQLADVLRLPAVPAPSLIRDFMAFEQHLLNIFPKLGREIPPVWYEIPVYYKGNPAAVGAHLQPIVIPDYAGDELDFEFEIAAVIGRGGRDISEETALDHVYGYTIYDDFSARAMQSREMSVGLGPAKGKDFDGAHVLGPVLVTADEIPDPYDLAMTARVNDEEWTTGSTGAMHWRFEQMIAHASRAETLRPAEVFGSGTVGGGSAAEVGRTLHAGDVVELTVERLGTLTNSVVGHEITQ